MLRLGGQIRLKGLGVHSAARLVYSLDPVSPLPLAKAGEFQRFEAEIGMDDSTGGRGSVQFRVLLDGEQRFASP